MATMLIGYARTSTTDQKAALLQKEAGGTGRRYSGISQSGPVSDDSESSACGEDVHPPWSNESSYFAD